VPGVADGIDDGPGGSLDGGHTLADCALSDCLARLHIATVDQNRARGAEARAAPELRAAHVKDVSEHPEQRRVGVAIVDGNLEAVDSELHSGLLPDLFVNRVDVVDDLRDALVRDGAVDVEPGSTGRRARRPMDAARLPMSNALSSGWDPGPTALTT
jgi:hypothetical protein